MALVESNQRPLPCEIITTVSFLSHGLSWLFAVVSLDWCTLAAYRRLVKT